MTKSRLLYVRRPLVLNPELAEVLDSGDLAITLQQVEYWMDKTDNVRYGHQWVYNSIPQWAEQFPWSESTTKRHFRKLRDMGLLITGRFGKTATDRTLWYRIDHEALDRLGESKDRSYQAENATGQNAPMEGVKMTRSIGSEWPDVKKELTETSSHRLQTETKNTLNADQKNIGVGNGEADPFFQDQHIPEHLRPYHDKLLELWDGKLRRPTSQAHFDQWTHGLQYIRELCENRGMGLEVLDRAFANKGWSGMELTDAHSLRVWLIEAEAELYREKQTA